MTQATLQDVRNVTASAQAARARRDVLAFAQRMYRMFEAPPHVSLIARLLQQVEAGTLRRLMVNLPPRHAKSTLCSMVFPAWYLGRNPTRDVILATHSQELSDRNSRAARALVQDDRYPFSAQLSAESASVSRWNLTDGGGCYAVGVGGSVTGRGANVLVLDDLQHDSGTEGERESTVRWLTEVAMPRLEPGASVVAIGTRFAEDDIFGRILASEGASEWRVVSLPAIADGEDDEIGRHLGEALWPDRVPLPELEERRRDMGSRWFECQFQQNPLPTDGNIIKAAWLEHRYETAPVEFDRVICALDSAAKTGIANDYSVIVTLGVLQNALYVLDVWRARVEFPDLVRGAKVVFERRQPSAFYVEDTSNAIALIQYMRKESALPIVPTKPIGSKISRVEGVSGLFESGRVLLPREAPWLNDFERELLGFPNAKHDDQVDALALALSHGARSATGGHVMFARARNRSRLFSPI